jgi:hypothetical protein
MKRGWGQHFKEEHGREKGALLFCNCHYADRISVSHILGVCDLFQGTG